MKAFVGRSIHLTLVGMACIGSICLAIDAPHRAFGAPAVDFKGLPARPFLSEQLSAVEADLAALMQWRGETSAEVAPRLEMQIDLRILARWLLSLALDAPEGSEMQCAGFIRATHMLSVARTTAVDFKAAPPLAPGQGDAMAALHAMTFKLPEAKTVGEMDETCRAVGVQLLSAGGPLPAGTRELSLMRPATPTGPASRASGDVADLSLGDLISRSRTVTAGPALRRQLAALARAASAAVPGPSARPGAPPASEVKAKEEAAALQAALARAVTFADGVAANTTLDAGARTKLESELGDGLALFIDVRTRGIGLSRVNALESQRQIFEHIRRLNLSLELQRPLSPLFALVQENPDQGVRVFEVVEAYLQLCAAFDTRPAAPALLPKETKLHDDLAKQFTAQREHFLTAAAAVDPTGGALGGSRLALNRLKSELDEIRKTSELLDMIERLPRAVQALNTYRPKPFGALEKRVAAAVSSLTETRPSVARDEAGRFLPDLVKLAALAEESGGGTASPGAAPPAPAEVAKAYAHGQVAALAAKDKEVITDLVNLAAGGKEIDGRRMARLEQSKTLIASLRDAAALEAALKRGDVLSRWVDWGLTAEQIRALLEPYRDAMRAAFDAAANDTSAPGTWQAIQARYAPLAALVIHAGGNADACAAMPAGIVGEISRLVTPLNVPAFSRERYATLAVSIWSRYDAAGEGQDARLAAAAADAIAVRLAKK